MISSGIDQTQLLHAPIYIPAYWSDPIISPVSRMDELDGSEENSIETQTQGNSQVAQRQAEIGVIYAKSAERSATKVADHIKGKCKLPKLFPCDNICQFKSSRGGMSSCACLYVAVDKDFSELLEEEYKTFKKIFSDLSKSGTVIHLIDYLDDIEDFHEVRYKLPKEVRNNVVEKDTFEDLAIGPIKIAEHDNMVVQVGDDNQLEVSQTGDIQSSQLGGSNYFHYRSDPSVTGYVLTIKTPAPNHELDVSIKKHIDDKKDRINVTLRPLGAAVKETKLGSVSIEVVVDEGAKIGPIWLKELITRILSEDIIAIMPDGTRMELVIRASIPLKPLDVSIFDGAPLKPRHVPLELSPVQIQYLKNTPPAEEIILHRLEKEGLSCEFDFKDNSLALAEEGENRVQLAQDIIKESVFMHDIPKEMDSVGTVSTKGSSRLEPKVIKVGNVKKLVGLANLSSLEGGHADSGVSMFEEKETIVHMPEQCFTYIRNYKWTELTTAVGKYPGVSIVPDKSGIKLRGQPFQIGNAAKLVKDTLERVKTFQINLGPLINVAVIGQVAGDIGQKYQCAITYQQHFGSGSSNPVSSVSPEYEVQTLSLRVSGQKKTKVKVVINTLENQKAHVIVNTTNRHLELNQGKGVTSCIFMAAGPRIQEELKMRYPKGIEYGEVAESGRGNIKTCKTIYHGAIPEFPKHKKGKDYKKQEDECFKWMVSLVFNCLIKASSSDKGYRSIAFPAFGTGFLEYPVQHVVQLMYTAINLYNEDSRSGSIRDIFIVIHPDTTLPVKQLFLAHRYTHELKTRHIAAVDQIDEEKKQKCEVRVLVGNTLLQVVHGSTREACDVAEAVLVLWSDKQIQNPDTNPGLTCTNPNKKDWKCSSYVSELSESRCVADSTTLPPRTLIHAYCKNDNEKSIQDAMLEGLHEAASMKCNTITIPIVSGGQLAQKTESTADVIVNALRKAQANIYVVTVAIPDVTVFVPFAKNVAALLHNKLQGPADIDKSVVAVDLWEKTFAGKASKSTAVLRSMMTMTSIESVLLITSDSEERNNKAAMDILTELDSKSPVKIQSD